MIETQKILDQLKQPLDVKRVKKRTGGGGSQLSYIEAHDAISTLNKIFGYDGWHFTLLQFEQFQTPKGIVFRQTVRLAVMFAGITIAREDVGIGIASNANSDQLEKGMKEAVSDGLKRAARMLGDQFGNELYDKLAPEHKGEQQAPRATTAQLQECEALRQKAVKLGFQTGRGAIPAKQEEGAEEKPVLAKTAAFRAFIQQHGDKATDATLPAPDDISTARFDAFMINGVHGEGGEGLVKFMDACLHAGLEFQSDRGMTGFESAATKAAGGGGSVIAESLNDADWNEYAGWVQARELTWEVVS